MWPVAAAAFAGILLLPGCGGNPQLKAYAAVDRANYEVVTPMIDAALPDPDTITDEAAKETAVRRRLEWEVQRFWWRQHFEAVLGAATPASADPAPSPEGGVTP